MEAKKKKPKSMKEKNSFFEMINKIDEPLAKLTKRRKKTPILIKLEVKRGYPNINQ
jgi:hypothetical protein